MDWLIDKAFADPVQRTALKGSSWGETYRDCNLFIAGPRGLPDLGRDIVVSIDKEFQERRKGWQQLSEQVEDAVRKANATQK
jgi:hypothetical protein